MSVLIFADQADGHIKKSSFEAISYGTKLAEQLGTTANALVLGVVVNHEEQLVNLGNYGPVTVLHDVQDSFNQFDAQLFTRAIAQAVEETKATVVIFSHNSTGKAIAPRLSARLKAGLVAGAVALPEASDAFIVKKSVFSGKAFARVSVETAVKIISLSPNSYGLHPVEGKAAVSSIQLAAGEPTVKIIATQKTTGSVPLSEAELVVSGGRGLKGPENWGLVEDLAAALGAATACSRPVADAHWRPHHEHVGQTGGAIAPNLYIAIGISGAIQHLAGVNRSKVIVVINKDPEAPFFKAADYGIVGDAFEVVPKITAAVKQLKSS